MTGKFPFHEISARGHRVPGTVRKDEVVQKKVLSSQLGSECHPGRIGFVYVELFALDKDITNAATVDNACKYIIVNFKKIDLPELPLKFLLNWRF
jgi:hypothetical protein